MSSSIHESVIFVGEVQIGENVTIYPYAVIGRPPQAPNGTTARRISNKNPKTIIGDNCVVGSHAVIYEGSFIGNSTLIGDGVRIREKVNIGSSCIIGMNTKIGPCTDIEDRVKIMDLCNIAADMLIEHGAFISQGTMCSNDIYMGRAEPTNKGPIVRRFATVGANSTILPAVEIGENAIVGAGSIVASHVEPRTVVMCPKAIYIRDVLDKEIKSE